MQTIKLKLNELVFDYDLYPRADVDAHHVAMMRAADQAGCRFPPYVIDAKSRRVIDGFHRGKKDRAEHGEECLVECVAKHYASEADMFLDSMRLNASHGRALTKYDRARCALRCRQFKIKLDQIASALGMTVGALKAVAEGRTASVRDAESADDGHEVALKRTIQHMAGKTLTAKQQAANGKLSGMEQQFYANQLIILIESNLLERENEALMERLAILSRLLEPICTASAEVVA